MVCVWDSIPHKEIRDLTEVPQVLFRLSRWENLEHTKEV